MKRERERGGWKKGEGGESAANIVGEAGWVYPLTRNFWPGGLPGRVVGGDDRPAAQKNTPIEKAELKKCENPRRLENADFWTRSGRGIGKRSD